jgi:hypothetical protein
LKKFQKEDGVYLVHLSCPKHTYIHTYIHIDIYIYKEIKDPRPGVRVRTHAYSKNNYRPTTASTTLLVSFHISSRLGKVFGASRFARFGEIGASQFARFAPRPTLGGSGSWGAACGKALRHSNPSTLLGVALRQLERRSRSPLRPARCCGALRRGRTWHCANCRAMGASRQVLPGSGGRSLCRPNSRTCAAAAAHVARPSRAQRRRRWHPLVGPLPNQTRIKPIMDTADSAQRAMGHCLTCAAVPSAALFTPKSGAAPVAAVGHGAVGLPQDRPRAAAGPPGAGEAFASRIACARGGPTLRCSGVTVAVLWAGFRSSLPNTTRTHPNRSGPGLAWKLGGVGGWQMYYRDGELIHDWMGGSGCSIIVDGSLWLMDG